MKKMIAVLLSTLLCLSLMPISVMAKEAAPYVTRGEVVDYLLDVVDDYNPNVKREDILKGYGKGVINENQNVSRIEALIMISRAFSDLPKPQGNDLRVGNAGANFTDVPAWAKQELVSLTDAGVIGGYPDGTLGVKDYITAEQLQTITKRIFALEGTNPRDDFYEFVNKKWLNSSTIPAGEMGNGAFNELMTSNEARIKQIVDELVKQQNPAGSKEQKIADYYLSALNMAERNKQGIKPIKPYLDSIEKASTVAELFDANLEIDKATHMGSLVSFGIMGDAKDSSVNALYYSGLGTGLDKNSYTSGDEKTKQAYTTYLTTLFKLSGADEQSAKQQAEAVYAFESELAKATLDIQGQNNVKNFYNPYSVNEFLELFPNVDMGKYMKEFKLDHTNKVIVMDVGLTKKTAEVLKDSNLNTLKSYMKADLLRNAGALLSDGFRQAGDQFAAQVYGIEGSKSDAQLALAVTQGAMSSYLEQIFVEKYFSKEAKQDVENMVHQFIDTYEKRIQALDWMSEPTKAKAIKKLEKMSIKIGYPDKWDTTLDQVQIKSYANGGSLFDNTIAITKAFADEAYKSLGKPVDKSKWGISAYTVNAFYNPLNNEITFPAGILQAPFYDINAKKETNLGAIGMVIAHEISHAFDNLGSSYDENGNAVDWWTAADYKKFEQKCNEVIAFYDGLEVVPGAYNNGQLTISENIADLGGMAASLQVVSQLPNPDYKAYFEGYATIWRQTMSKEMSSYLTTIDTHSANKVRVNRTVANFPEFYKAYGITPEDAMYVAPENRVGIW
ncbi:S-layer homology domain-containing protein [Paenibacillus sp. KQZ6P-2]|uniref:S-layer homology domain-containing protein n=1 Tax=Paenibacillus mangrovi TaxID=2931978 RepID=A0A9X1WMX7_9BACL|nr:M13-type metalloendopeptidase [Paenibacillus mangrovi]MCJ8011844.1 S-layer homology domain-containing protein [Paenibacillus mangrovi]